jgi:hypothetical protein
MSSLEPLCPATFEARVIHLPIVSGNTFGGNWKIISIVALYIATIVTEHSRDNHETSGRYSGQIVH